MSTIENMLAITLALAESPLFILPAAVGSICGAAHLLMKGLTK
jgi:hypothetical protein